MSHLQYIPGDPRLVDQLVYELKSKGIFDQFRKDCIADVDTRPAYQNLRQRVETSVSTFLSRQCWKPDLNKNQLREKLRKHILDGNYLEQGVERIVDQVVNPKVASVFIPQVEDLVYNYLGITRKKSAPVAETSNGKILENDLLPTDLEAVSPGSVKSHDDKNEEMDVDSNLEEMKMEVDNKEIVKDEMDTEKVKADPQDTQLSGLSDLTSNDSNSLDKIHIPLPSEEIKPENIPAPENSPPKSEKVKVELEKIQLPQESDPSTDIPLPDGIPKSEKESYFKTELNSEDDDSSSDSSLRRNMSPLTPIRNFNNENSCDAQQAFENNSEDNKSENKETLEPSTFRFTIEAKETENSSDAVNAEKKEAETLAYQFDNQMNINTFNTPLYDESSSSNHLRIDYESDVNSKMNTENKVPEPDHNSEDLRKDKKPEEKKSSHKNSHHRDLHRHSTSSRDRRSDSKQSSSKDTKSEKKSSKDDHKSSKDDHKSSKDDHKSSKDDHKSSSKSSSHKDKSSDRSDKKDGRDSSKHRSSSSHKSSSSHRDSKSHRSSSSSHRHSSSSKHSDEKKSSSSTQKDRSDKSSEKYSKEKSSKDSKSSSSHRSDKDRKSSSSSKRKSEDKDKERQKKDKKEADDHYSASGRGNPTRRSTDRDSNDGNSSSSKGSHNQPSSKSSESKKDSKGSTSKSDNTSTSGDSPAPSDKDSSANEMGRKIKGVLQVKPIVRIENHLETPISSPPRLPFVPDVTLKKPKFAANMHEAKKLMKMRKFLDEEQKRMNQEAALLLEFQANVRPSLSQVYSSIPGPELEFACGASSSRDNMIIGDSQAHSDPASPENVESISDILSAAEQVDNKLENSVLDKQKLAIKISETIEAGGELEDEADGNPHAATVQIENIIGSDISGTCEMEVDIKDDNNVKVIESGPNVIVENIEILPEIEKKELIFHNATKNEQKIQIPESIQKDNDENVNPNNMEPENDGIEETLRLMEDDDKHTEYFQVTIITEELSETEDDIKEPVETVQVEEEICSGETNLNFFAENEKYSAELERDTFSRFYKSFTEKFNTNKMYLINCDTYEENILKEVSQNFGNFEFVNYYKNGHFKLKTPKNVVKNVNLDSEITLPTNINGDREKSPKLFFSPVKSECSFELSSDYDAKLEEMVSKTSRKEIMEIILGGIVDDSTSEASEMPTIDYCTESNIESNTENSIKRKYCEVGSSLNNNRQVLTPNKIRKLSGSDQISSTTEESEQTSNNNMVSNPVRSKYLGRAKRVGLSRPKRSILPNSPSSDKSVENYEENVQTSQPNGKLKGPRKVQRYDTSDLYKPKLHYLSRRNNIS